MRSSAPKPSNSSQTRTTPATAALLMGTALAAFELNIVGTAMPTLVARLGGLRLYGLVFSAYMLTSTVTLPLYGRLADLRGRKPVYLASIALFLLGSALCGMAPSMAALVGFRALQGLGAGGVIPVTMTVFGDLFPAERRALVQGLFSTIWGTCSVLGPLVGGLLLSHVTWRWIFWVNLPIGLVAAFLFHISYHDTRQSKQVGGLDYKGTLLLLGALCCLVVGLQQLQDGDLQLWGLMTGATVLTALFVFHEYRTSAPLIPLDVFKDRAMMVTCLAGLPLGAILFGLVTFAPLFVQGVLHGSPTRAGMALVPLSLLWTVGTFATGPLVRRFGYRPVVLLGSLFCVAGTFCLWRLAGPKTGIWMPMFLIGAGMGLNLTASLIAVQDAMPWHLRGIATALLQFARVIGGMIAVTTLGTMVTSRFALAMAPHLRDDLEPADFLDPSLWAG